MIIIVTSGPRSLLNVAFSCLLIKGARGRGSRWHRFSLIVVKRGRYFLSLVTFPYNRREDIYLEWTHHSASPRFSSSILSAVSRSLPFAFASCLSVWHLERVYFRLVSKVNIVAVRLGVSASAFHDANKSDASRKEVGKDEGKGGAGQSQRQVAGCISQTIRRRSKLMPVWILNK